MLQQVELKQLLHYSPTTGIFIWKIALGSIKAGSVAGCVVDGYRIIQIKGIPYKAGRLAWFYIYGKWPQPEIDHRNRRKDDNRISNLREATRTMQVTNVGPRKKISSLPQGVRINPASEINPFVAQIQINGERIHLGVYPTARAASLAYKRKRNDYTEKFPESSGDTPSGSYHPSDRIRH